MAATLVALYIVTTQPPRERFEESSESDGKDASKPPTTSPASKAGVVDSKDAERVDGMVFKVYMDVFGVPPTPSVSKHYASITVLEKLDEAGLKDRVDKDSRAASEKMTTSEDTGGGAPGAQASEPATESNAELDADLKALKQKAESIAKMSGPVSASPGGGPSDMATKLRSIAGQVSELARRYDVDVPAKTEPKGIESFISF